MMPPRHQFDCFHHRGSCFTGGTKFLPVWLSPRQMVVTWNTLVGNHEAKDINISLVSRQAMGNVGKNFKIGNLMKIFGKVRFSLNISNDVIY